MTSKNETESGYHLSTSMNFTPMSRFNYLFDKTIQLFSRDRFFLPERKKEIVRTSSLYDAKKLDAIKSFSLVDVMSLDKLRLPNAGIDWEVKPLAEIYPRVNPVSFYKIQIDEVFKSYNSLLNHHKGKYLPRIEANEFCRACEEALKSKVQ